LKVLSKKVRSVLDEKQGVPGLNIQKIPDMTKKRGREHVSQKRKIQRAPLDIDKPAQEEIL
jgi:hypothetical protein